MPTLTGANEAYSDVSYMIDSYKTFLGRASTQRMFVLSRTQGVEENCHTHDENCPIHQIKIAGSTGNVYTVVISHLPICSCPNTSFKRNDSGEALCKHVLYVLHYVLKAPQHFATRTRSSPLSSRRLRTMRHHCLRLSLRWRKHTMATASLLRTTAQFAAWNLQRTTR
jgi:hypothetical protein